METTNTLLPILYAAIAVVITIVLVGIIAYWRLKDRMDTLREDAHESLMMNSLIASRRTNHVWKCLVTGKAQAIPKDWLTAEERRLHKRFLEIRQEIIGEELDDNTQNNQP